MKKILAVLALVFTATFALGALTGCDGVTLEKLEDSAASNNSKSGSASNSGKNSGKTNNSSGGGYAYTPTYPTFDYTDEDVLWVGAEGCYYDVGTYEEYKENAFSETRPILTNLEGGTVSFVINSSVDVWLEMDVRTAIDTGRDENGNRRVIWASDKFELTVNGAYYSLDAQEGVDEKWLWQPVDDWWTNANYIDANFGWIHLAPGKTTFSLKVKTGNVQLDCFIFHK